MTLPLSPRIASLLWLVTVVLVTLNLRPFLTAIGPLTPAIQAHTGMGLQALAWLTLLPMALIGAGTWLTPAVQARLGVQPTMLLALALIVLGCALRLAGGVSAMLIATAVLCGMGAALAQGMLLGLIKRHTPRHVAPMMGVYSAALMSGGALGAQFSPLAVQWGLSWQVALALWAWPALLALGLTWYALGALPLPAVVRQRGSDTRWLLRRCRTWLLMLAFGLMNGGYAMMVAWLAPYYQERGWSAAHSGLLVAVVSVAQAAAAFVFPLLAAHHPDRRPWLWLSLACQAAGFAALAVWPDTAPMTAAVVLGVGIGGCFALFMVVALDHLHHPLQAGALTALMQGGGFMLTAVAPWAMARLYQATGGYQAGWLTQLGAVLVAALLVARFRPGHYDAVMRPPAG
jgi:CP family cyanate transporter-like MFS transporter